LRVPKLVNEAHDFHQKLDTFIQLQNRPSNPWPTRLLAVCAVALVCIAVTLVLR